MTPEQKLKHLILLKNSEWTDVPISGEVTADNIDELYDEANGEGWELQDASSEVRCLGQKTGLPDRFMSRHYECEEVAIKAPDGTWVGWTYWHGGGKHGEPEAIDWMDDAYDVACTEEEKMVIVRTFTKIDQPQ